ncbi:MAG: hypothetical protein A2493_00035 [Candidatus Magasanikbacteria bacterium RIFOXYC12_FULL_33_11]|uniref:Methyltransferase type 11 domain-containing protein n=1 Tax=Candidatus Magasanikbacteria bacterium RIFOXYC12_FULL_33_11 TaxID=1798701 RepID=A0A1F6NRC6_9BACT|nr:MAG: hypothetical protein A2493_00035 [Candidatus Magasanikbacteria bacterium RIFOXYC12_FULL_33_11]
MKRNNTVYINKNSSFQNYLKWCDEKQVVLSKLREVVGINKNSLLDIGAGDGTFAYGLEDLFEFITLIEPSINTIETLKNKCVSEKYTIIHDKFENVVLDKKFDVILVSHAIRFLQNPENKVEEIKKLLNSDGVLIVVTNAFDEDYYKFYKTFEKEIIKDPKDKFYFDYKKILEENYSKLFIETAKAELIIPSVEDAVNMLDFFYDVSISDIPQKTIDEVRNYFIKNYDSEKVVFKYPQNIYIAKK